MGTKIAIERVSKRFGDRLVLNELNLNLNEGERVALIGQNGSGKTTLIRCILGLHRFEGNIRVLGQSVRESREEVLNEIGFVPQSAPILRFNIGEYLRFYSRLCGVDEEAVIEVAKYLDLDLPHLRKQLFRKLSGGMKQKLLIAAALARRPSLLIMDEPTANLDAKARAAFFELLADLPEHCVLLLSSHRVDELAGLVTRLVELDSGGVVKDDAVSVTGIRTLDQKVACGVVLNQPVASVMNGLQGWGFVYNENKQIWEGMIGAPDRFRFLADLSRWSGAVAKVNMEEQ